MYIVRIVGPSGAEHYLSNGRLVQYSNAKWYPHPSAARRARDAFLSYGMVGTVIAEVIDPKDPERRVPQW